MWNITPQMVTILQKIKSKAIKMVDMPDKEFKSRSLAVKTITRFKETNKWRNEVKDSTQNVDKKAVWRGHLIKKLRQ